MRKVIYWIYAFLAVVIMGAVFLVGCDGTSGGGSNNNNSRMNCSWSAIGSQSYCQELVDDNDCRNGGNYYPSTRICAGYNCAGCYN